MEVTEKRRLSAIILPPLLRESFIALDFLYSVVPSHVLTEATSRKEEEEEEEQISGPFKKLFSNLDCLPIRLEVKINL